MNTAEPPANCCDAIPEPSALHVDAARQSIIDGLTALAQFEQVTLEQALNRVLAEDLLSAIDVPPYRNSAMDGIAVRAAGLAAQPPYRFREVGAAFAGRAFEGSMSAGDCVRITTGAVVPEFCDTVIMQEQLREEGGNWFCEAGIRTGQNVRQAGEDLARGQQVVAAGKRLMPAELGLLASLGHSEVKVVRRLRVAIVSTGDEISTLGETLRPGTIFDSNRFTLHGMLRRLGAEVIDLGVVRDDAEAMRTTLSEAADCADVVISSGGVSVGEADFIKPVLESLGSMQFCKVLIRPGRPFTYGRIGKAAFFGLPGNPVAVMVIFYAFLQPALRRLMGESSQAPVRMRARSMDTLRKRPGRTEYQRGVLDYDDTGEARVHKTGSQGSGILSSMSQANCFIVLAPEQADVAAGESVIVEPFFGLV